MINEQFERTRLLLGDEGIEKLKNSRVAVFGIGGVGGHLAEALVRSGVGEIDLIDDDIVSVSNINRQAVATLSTVGKAKVQAAKERFLDINSDCKINIHQKFFTPETADEFDFSQYDYVADAIDTVTGKIEIIMRCNEAGTCVISSMGAGNKLDPTRFEVTDIYKTETCPLARVMRRELKKRGIKKLKVVYSKEPALTPLECGKENGNHQKRQPPGSVAFLPSVAGLIMAGEIIKDLIKDE
ncbi:MAG: tRNA threonylcarbamoyladenosine dehydratase [Clostridia bacterium]|nr:tRNA threonylcarbamoyladenosine dehydratase [Clostridia bacterium]